MILEFSKDFRKILKYQISSKSVQWEPSFSMRTDRRKRHDECKSRAILGTRLKPVVA